MERHFDKDLQDLKDKLVRMGSMVEDALGEAIASLVSHDRAAAERVIGGDDRINSFELEIDEAIVDLLALNQPVAVDLRLIIAAQKINNDLERIGDHVVNLAESALVLDKKGLNAPFKMVVSMSDTVRRMVRQALDGFIHLDPSIGRAVLDQDDMIDDLNRKVFTSVMTTVKSKPALIESGVELIRVSRNIERVADLATNIAEEVIFVAQAKVVKHGTG